MPSSVSTQSGHTFSHGKREKRNEEEGKQAFIEDIGGPLKRFIHPLEAAGKTIYLVFSGKTIYLEFDRGGAKGVGEMTC